MVGTRNTRTGLLGPRETRRAANRLLGKFQTRTEFFTQVHHTLDQFAPSQRRDSRFSTAVTHTTDRNGSKSQRDQPNEYHPASVIQGISPRDESNCSAVRSVSWNA